MVMRLLLTLPRARRWVQDTVAASAPRGVRLIDCQGADRLVSHYQPALLERTRVVMEESCPRPPLEQWGLHGADDFVGFNAAGLTLRDTIFIKRRRAGDDSLLFHELVHVVQWRLLGVNRFLALYGLMLLEDGYRRSPLETMAYDLQRLYESGRQFEAGPIIRRRTQETLAAFGRRSWRHRALLAAAGGRRLGQV